MANVIKNSSTIQPNTIKVGNFVIGVNQGGYGSTSVTGYVNGKTPNVGGYVVYKYVLAGSPQYYVMNNDTELINFVIGLGGYAPNIEYALLYMKNSGDYSCINMDYPNIVTSGLTLNLDAGYVNSYPKSFSNWGDLSGNFNTGTLINGSTYSSSGGGCIVSDGTNDGVTANDSSSLDISGSFTLDGWVWFNQHKLYGSLLVKGSGGSGQLFNYCFFFYDTYIICGFGDGSNFYSVGISAPLINTWHHITGTYDLNTLKFYLNGVILASSPVVATPYQNTNPLNIIQSDYPIDGKVISAKVYNRALSANEVLQNYYAGLQRLIPTNGLVLWLDGLNTNTNVIAPTTANDMSGNNYNGSFLNGAKLAYNDGVRVFSFDGVDDYISISNPLNQSNLTQVWSVSVWVKQNTGTSGPQYIINGLNNGINSDWYGNGPLLYLNGGVNDYYTYTSTYASIAGTGWRHLVYLFQNSTGLRQIYKDGVLAGSSVGPNNTSTPSGQGGTWYIGQMSGNIGDVRIYNRVLTATEISTIYTAGRSRYGV